MKVGRRLTRIGAVALKNTVYVLPRSDSCQEDFQWVVREVMGGGGEAALLEARFVDGLSDADIENLFRNARDNDFSAIAEESRKVEARIASALSDADTRRQVETEIARLERRLEEVSLIDFFAAPGRETAHGLVAALRARVTPPATPSARVPRPGVAELRGRSWVTRVGIHVDRIASAWLIRRFIDPDATFKFVAARGYVPQPGELRFDMFEAEYSHEGDMCTFEVLCERFELEVPGTRAIAELVHDIDLKDKKFGRLEAPGLAAQIAGISMLHREDETRLLRGSESFDELLTYFAKKRD